MKMLSRTGLICLLAVMFSGCVGLGSSDSSLGLLNGLFTQTSGNTIRAGADQTHARAAAVASWKIDDDPAIAELTAKVKKNPRGALLQLVQALEKGKKDDFERFRALHDWVAETIAYDFGAFKGESPMVIEPYDVIAHGSSVCEGYSSLFQLMCSLAGLECRVVSGYGRGYGFDGFTEGDIPFSSDHAWNAVRVGDGWYLIDTTWDAGGVSPSGEFHFAYSTQYLFTSPEIFLCTHFPEQPTWQLIASPLSFQAFKSLPYFEGAFGTHGLQWVGDLKRLSTTGAEQDLVFKVPTDLSLNVSLVADGELQGARGAVATSREGDAVRARVLFPAPGRYYVSLSAYRGSDITRSEYLGTLYYVATSGSDKRLPSIDPAGKAIGFAFADEDAYVYRVNGVAKVVFSCPQDVTVLLQDSAYNVCANHSMVSGQAGARFALVSFPSVGEYTLTFMAKDPQKPGTSKSVASVSFLSTKSSEIEYPSIADNAAGAGFSMGDSVGYQSRVGAEARFTFAYPGATRGYLFDAAGKSQAGRLLCADDGDRHTVTVSFPSPGEYSVWLYASPAAETGDYAAIAGLHFTAQGSSDRTFPELYASAATRGFTVVAPLDGRLKTGQMIDFDVTGPAGAAVYVSMGGSTVQLREVNGHYRGSLRASGTDATIFAHGKEETTAHGLARYVVQAP